MVAFLDAYFYFVVYSVAGWICEDIYVGIGKKKFVNRGFLYGPYCPIYGFGALIVLYPLLKLGDHPILVFFGGMILTSALEYFTSWLMETLFHEKWWDYSTYRFNLNGRICLLNSTLFGLMSLIVVFVIQPMIEKVCDSIPLLQKEIFLGAFTIVFVLDLIVTVVHLMKRRNVIGKMHEEIEKLRVQFEADTQLRLDSAQLKMAEVQERMTHWVLERPELNERLAEVNSIMERLNAYKNTRLSKAFPERALVANMKESRKLADLIQKINGKLNGES